MITLILWGGAFLFAAAACAVVWNMLTYRRRLKATLVSAMYRCPIDETAVEVLFADQRRLLIAPSIPYLAFPLLFHHIEGVRRLEIREGSAIVCALEGSRSGWGVTVLKRSPSYRQQDIFELYERALSYAVLRLNWSSRKNEVERCYAFQVLSAAAIDMQALKEGQAKEQECSTTQL
ncbi:MAG: hypothetical protein H0U76_22380 [Ktedonobacteraceae bacterium]|nr:hypothetical protein [Ktedonobacteraceae bacterium]